MPARAGVRRVIHISAIGASAEGRTDFARTRAQADAHLATLDLDWMIPRPALVLAPAAYGGTAMLRALAAFPLFAPGISGADRIQVVDVDDVTETVALCLKPGAPAKTIWEVAHPHVHALGGIVAALRGWLGFPPRPVVTVPRWMMVLVSFFATLAGLLGWRSPARPTALAQLLAGVVGDPARWMQATGIKPKDLPEILAQRPASVQEAGSRGCICSSRWRSWGWPDSGSRPGWLRWGRAAPPLWRSLQQRVFQGAAVELTVLLGALFDITLGVLLLVRKFARAALIVMLVATPFYLLIGTWLAPALWLDPLGPLVKIVPMLVATVLTLAIMDER